MFHSCKGRAPNHTTKMGNKREKIKKAKESGKIQDQSMANEIENEMTSEGQEANEIEYGKTSANPETDVIM